MTTYHWQKIDVHVLNDDISNWVHAYICYYVRTVVFENFRVGSTASSCSSSLSSINIWKKSSSLSCLKSFHSNQFSCHQTTSIIHPSLVVPWSCSSNFFREFSVKRKRNATKTTIKSVNKKTKTKLKFHTYFVDLSSEWLVTFCVKTRVTTKKNYHRLRQILSGWCRVSSGIVCRAKLIFLLRRFCDLFSEVLGEKKFSLSFVIELTFPQLIVVIVYRCMSCRIVELPNCSGG